jgi:hypothetical protein
MPKPQVKEMRADDLKAIDASGTPAGTQAVCARSQHAQSGVAKGNSSTKAASQFAEKYTEEQILTAWHNPARGNRALLTVRLCLSERRRPTGSIAFDFEFASEFVAAAFRPARLTLFLNL